MKVTLNRITQSVKRAVNRYTVFLLILFSILSLIPLVSWFRPGYLIAGGDFFPPVFAREILASSRLNPFYVWSDTFTGGNPAGLNVTKFFPFIAFWAFFEWFGLQTLVIQKLWFVLVFLSMSFSMLYLMQVILPRACISARITSMLLYIFNPFISLWPTIVSDSIILAYIMAPILLGIFIRGIQRNFSSKCIASFVVANLFLTTSAGNPPIWVMAWLPIVLYIPYHLAFSTQRAKFLVYVTKCLGLALLVNLWWFVSFTIPMIASGTVSLTSGVGTLDFVLAKSLQSSILNILRVLGKWSFPQGITFRVGGESMLALYYPYYMWYDSPVVVFSSILLIALALGYTLFRPKQNDFQFLAILALIGVFLAKGLHAPLAFINMWIYKHVPGFMLFREPITKFVPLMLLSIAPLLGYVVQETHSKLRRRLNAKSALVEYLLVGLVVSAIIVQGIPLLVGLIVTPKRGLMPEYQVRIPSYLAKADTLIESSELSRTLVTPQDPFWTVYYSWGYMGSDRIPYFVRRPLVISVLGGEFGLEGYFISPYPTSLANLIYQELIASNADAIKLMGLFNVRHVLQRNDLDWTHRGNQNLQTGSPEQFKRFARATSSSLEYEGSVGEWNLYRVSESSFVPHIYTSSQLVAVKADISAVPALAQFSYLDALPNFLLLFQQQSTKAPIYPRADTIITVGSELDSRTQEILDLTQSQRQAHIFTGREERNSFYIPTSKEYSLQARVVPKDYLSDVSLLAEKTDWQAEQSRWTVTDLTSAALHRSVENHELPLIMYGQNWHDSEHDHHGGWRWGRNDETLILFNPTNYPLTGDLSLRVTTIYERGLKLSLNGKRVYSSQLPGHYASLPRRFLVDSISENLVGYKTPLYEPKVPPEWAEIVLEDLVLQPGTNELHFYSPQGTDVKDHLLGDYDRRPVGIKLWDDMTFHVRSSMLDVPVAADDVGHMQYEVSFEDRQFVLDIHFDGDGEEQELVLMERDFDSVDLEEFPQFRFSYTVNKPGAATVDAVFSIDYTDDGQVDGYVIAQPSATDDGKEWQVNLNIFEAAKERFSDPYYKERRDLKLVHLYLVPHKKWGLDVKNTGRGGLYTFRFGDLNLYNERSLIVPSDEVLGSQEGWADWQIKDTDTYSETFAKDDIYRKLPYPAKTLEGKEQTAEVSALFDVPLVELNGQPITFQPPTDQANLLDWNGYMLEPETVSLAAGMHELEILTHPTFQVDLVEIANKPYEPKKPNAEVTFRKVNPTRYNVEVDAKDDFWLVFSESFHPDWKAYIVENRSTIDRTWYEWSALLTWFAERGQRSELTDHYQVNAYANGWYVPKTGKYTVTLEFTPQRLYEIGVIVSSITFFACVGYLVWGWIRRRKN